MFSNTRHWFLRKKISNGYTLIEVVIAIAIFSFMIALATAALNQGLKQYQHMMDKGINLWDAAKNLWVTKSFNAAIDYYVYTEGKKWFPYFHGSQDAVSYVSLSPVAGDLPVVVWLKNEKMNTGKRSLVYYELPVYTKDYKELERMDTFHDYKKGWSVKLLENVENVKIRFFGYDVRKRQSLWSNGFDGSLTKSLPALVEITYIREGKKSEIVFGISTNSMIKTHYAEIYQ